MHVKTFYPGESSYPITVLIDEQYINFYGGLQTKNIMYSIKINDWIKPISTWPEYMDRKPWFNLEMRKFINHSLDLKDSEEWAKYD